MGKCALQLISPRLAYFQVSNDGASPEVRRDGKMAMRWAAAALLITEKNFRKVMGYRDLWMLEAALGRKTRASQEEVA